MKITKVRRLSKSIMWRVTVTTKPLRFSSRISKPAGEVTHEWYVLTFTSVISNIHALLLGTRLETVLPQDANLLAICNITSKKCCIHVRPSEWPSSTLFSHCAGSSDRKLIVCGFVIREHIAETTCPNLTKFSVFIACGRSSVFLWWYCNMYFRFMNYVMFFLGSNGPYDGMTLRHQHRSSVVHGLTPLLCDIGCVPS